MTKFFRYCRITFHANAWEQIATAIQKGYLFESWLQFLKGPFKEKYMPLPLLDRAGELLVQSFKLGNLANIHQVILMSVYREYHPEYSTIGDRSLKVYQKLVDWGDSMRRRYTEDQVKEDMRQLIQFPLHQGVTSPVMAIDIVFSLKDITGILGDREFTRHLAKLSTLDKFGEGHLHHVRYRLTTTRYKRFLRKAKNHANRQGCTGLADELHRRHTDLLEGEVV